MTQEDKELLQQDLCARLPYGVVVETQLVNVQRAKYPVLKVLQSYMLCDFMQTIENVIHKPYLRPMSSMTEEEKEELKNLFDAEEVTSYSICYIEGGTLVEYLSPIPYSFCYKIIDWLNKNMFDYRGLIVKGLALEAPEGMYN